MKICEKILCMLNYFFQAVMNIIEKESKRRKRKYPLKKKISLKVNIMTYGVLAMACKTKQDADRLLNEMTEKQLKYVCI